MLSVFPPSFMSIYESIDVTTNLLSTLLFGDIVVVLMQKKISKLSICHLPEGLHE